MLSARVKLSALSQRSSARGSAICSHGRAALCPVPPASACAPESWPRIDEHVRWAWFCQVVREGCSEMASLLERKDCATRRAQEAAGYGAVKWLAKPAPRARHPESRGTTASGIAHYGMRILDNGLVSQSLRVRFPGLVFPRTLLGGMGAAYNGFVRVTRLFLGAMSLRPSPLHWSPRPNLSLSGIGL
jgi:hypothetical protein